MCRLFGLIANKEVDIYFSMQEASKSFKVLGKIHRDGWGIGWYEKSIARIKKYAETAPESEKFVEVSREVKSKIFIATLGWHRVGILQIKILTLSDMWRGRRRERRSIGYLHITELSTETR